MVMVVVACPLELPGSLLLQRIRIDAVLLEDLVYRILNDRIEVPGIAGLFGRLHGGSNGRCKLVLQTVWIADCRRSRA